MAIRFVTESSFVTGIRHMVLIPRRKSIRDRGRIPWCLAIFLATFCLSVDCSAQEGGLGESLHVEVFKRLRFTDAKRERTLPASYYEARSVGEDYTLQQTGVRLSYPLSTSWRIAVGMSFLNTAVVLQTRDGGTRDPSAGGNQYFESKLRSWTTQEVFVQRSFRKTRRIGFSAGAGALYHHAVVDLSLPSREIFPNAFRSGDGGEYIQKFDKSFGSLFADLAGIVRLSPNLSFRVSVLGETLTALRFEAVPLDEVEFSPLSYEIGINWEF